MCDDCDGLEGWARIYPNLLHVRTASQAATYTHSNSECEGMLSPVATPPPMVGSQRLHKSCIHAGTPPRFGQQPVPCVSAAGETQQAADAAATGDAGGEPREAARHPRQPLAGARHRRACSGARGQEGAPHGALLFLVPYRSSVQTDFSL